MAATHPPPPPQHPGNGAGVLRSIFSTIVSTFLGSNQDVHPMTQSIDFQARFEQEYGTNHPTFAIGPFSQVIQQTKRDCRLLLVYLHSEYHSNTPTFCRETLCSELFVEFCNENFALWGASVSNAEGFRVSNLLEVSTYPFIGVLSFDGQSMIASFEGATDVTTLVDKLTNVLELEGPRLTAARIQLEERERDRLVREEQELAYQRALEEDQEKERKLREEEERLQTLEREAFEAEERKKIELERKRRNLPPEPKGNEGVQVLVRLPNGNRLNRRFAATDLVESLYDYVDTNQEEIELETYDLVTNFPRKVFSEKSLSIQEVDPSKQIMLLVALK